MVWNAATGALVREVVLAEGNLYGTVDDAVADGKRPGFLGNVTIKEDLTGLNDTGAVVGSSDGYLYAVEPCTGSLLWSMNFRFPVGEAIFADTDDDGIDEIVVTVADGYLYGVDREMFPAPGWVHDTDPPSGVTDEDVDSIETQDTLYAAWEPVPLATSYEYGILTASGNFITVPNFINVGPDISVESTGLGLMLGGRYYFAVRAIGPGGSSSEAVSDGVTIVDETDPTITINSFPDPFSPDGDGHEDTTLMNIRMTDRRGLVSYNLAIMDSSETVVVKNFGVKDLFGVDVLEIVEWDGTDDMGAVVLEGEYVILGAVIDEGGHEVEGRAAVHVVLTGAEEPFPELPDGVEEELAGEDVEVFPEVPDAAPDSAVDGTVDVPADDAAADGEPDETDGSSGCGCRIVG